MNNNETASEELRRKVKSETRNNILRGELTKIMRRRDSTTKIIYFKIQFDTFSQDGFAQRKYD